ncbi:MAG TPA: SDR family NAD(P)-dependent oxidoreductase, partial [Chitinivibrionales bacterium]
MEWYTGKRTVITGGSSGIGKAAAILVAQAGGHMCICARDQVRLDAALTEIRSHASSSDQKITGIILDVADRARVKAAA